MTTFSQLVSALRNVPTRQFIAALAKEGFEERKTRGGHRVYRNPDGRRVVIAFHRGNDTLPRDTLRAFLQATEWNQDDAQRLGLL